MIKFAQIGNDITIRTENISDIAEFLTDSYIDSKFKSELFKNLLTTRFGAKIYNTRIAIHNSINKMLSMPGIVYITAAIVSILRYIKVSPKNTQNLSKRKESLYDLIYLENEFQNHSIKIHHDDFVKFNPNKDLSEYQKLYDDFLKFVDDANPQRFLNNIDNVYKNFESKWNQYQKNQISKSEFTIAKQNLINTLNRSETFATEFVDYVVLLALNQEKISNN